MAIKSADYPKSIKIDTKFFAKKWAQWNSLNPPKHNLRVPDDWDAIHQCWRDFVLEMTSSVMNYESTEKNVLVYTNEWMKEHDDFADDDGKFDVMSKKFFTKVRNIQKKLAIRSMESTPKGEWELKYFPPKTKGSNPRIDWDASTLPPAPFGMECKNKNPPTKKKSSSTTWGDIESYFLTDTPMKE
tara:strand:+ start:287 stop:844 length:558 start_codon:yes stop_codon:yes gene_type:complete